MYSVGCRVTLAGVAGFELRYEGAETEFNCDRLQPGHSYRVRLRCYNGAQYSEVSSCSPGAAVAVHVHVHVCCFTYRSRSCSDKITCVCIR